MMSVLVVFVVVALLSLSGALMTDRRKHRY
jgi:hypothetical protein